MHSTNGARCCLRRLLLVRATENGRLSKEAIIESRELARLRVSSTSLRLSTRGGAAYVRNKMGVLKMRDVISSSPCWPDFLEKRGYPNHKRLSEKDSTEVENLRVQFALSEEVFAGLLNSCLACVEEFDDDWAEFRAISPAPITLPLPGSVYRWSLR